MKKLLSYFSKTEYCLLFSSLFFILLSFCIFDRTNYLSLTASLLGATALIFNAKGNPFGQILILIFSFLYAFISFSFCYYGEMITYLGMTAPMALFSFIEWIRHPYQQRRSEVRVNRLKAKEFFLTFVVAIPVTLVFYFILKAFDTANLIPSTLSVTTSFIAAYLTLRRSPYFAVAYAVNDIVLMILWFLATLQNVSYVSVLICFLVFFINDIYSFFSWLRMQKKQYR